MKCTKTMLYVTAALGLAALVSYLAFPEAKLFVLANTSILVSLICPISMLVMMWSMRGHKDGAGSTTTSTSEDRLLRQTAEAGRESAS